LNNSDVIIGWVYKWEEGFFKSAVWSTPGSVKLLPSPRDANFDQYYLESFNDQGKIGGFAAFSGEVSRLAGVTIDTLSGELQIDEEHLIFSLNNRGSILRSGSMDNAAAAELVRSGGITPIVTPALHREPNDPKLAEDDVIFGSATDDDGSDGRIGIGSDCVIWKAPSFAPLLINPPGKLQSDDCWITSRNRAGQMLIQHDRHDQYDELIFSKLYLTDGRTFRSLEALHPDLAKFDRLYLVKINANGQIALNGYKDGSVRGLILTPRAKGAAPNPRFVN
ncbi:MAG: hypothetical protein K1X83_15225, partial [Oligoflexia bacterium]|nr:hypothetical protein [Oligoflexia bacterium]